MDLNNVDLLIRYIMVTAGHEDPGSRQLGPIHILKYIYLADLAFATGHQGETFTGLPWMFYKFGPWAMEAHQRIAPVVKSMGAEERVYPSKHVPYRQCPKNIEYQEADAAFSPANVHPWD